MEVNDVDDCVYHKFSESKFIFLVLYVDGILLASNEIGLLHETKKFLSKKFEMKDLGDASFVLGIQIHRYRSRGILGLSQKRYINKVLKSLEIKEMQKIPYASAVGSLMYARVCTRPDITFIVGVLGRYLSNPDMNHWKAVKRVIRYLQRTKDYMLTYWRSDKLEIIGYSDSDFDECLDTRRSTSEFIACHQATVQAIWLRNFIAGLRVVNGIKRPLKIYYDNRAVVLNSNNNKSSTKSRHIERKFLIVKERIQSGIISIEHIGTNSMIASAH
ncbi:hypothetical protein LIER_33696 [Lithospermum erythrorhizon]|uniref:Reverse transcriptase Ty1/copia-type domain-containing protein n=1 Tax=Lithospermum erythrorhizon TaxID=34254 RepID=A0AAV3RXK9_LITER